MNLFLTLTGFLLAFLVNLFFPQVAEGVKLKSYTFGGIAIDDNLAYRLVLLALALYYGIYRLVLFVKKADQEKINKFGKGAKFRFAIGIALALWDLLGTKLLVLPQPFFPGPAVIMDAFLGDTAFIWKNTLYSLRLFVAGFSVGVVTGVLTGVLIGWYPKARYWILPVLNICGVIPAVAWMPFALTLFPTSFAAATFLIAICSWFPVATMTADGVQGTPKSLFELSRTFGAGQLYQIFHIAIPHAMPQIFTGIMTAAAFGFTTLVMAEMMGQPGGLGYYINTSKVWSAYYKVFAAIVVMAVLFSAILKVVGVVQRYVLRWQKGVVR
ncbi:ABC transporter permease [Fibrobacter sp.]|uniref:ABC transporter permease n=1 Tax=Fibrobacter sp. TaxID=35828 RepID=UPI00386361EF